jgi:hypothetical protein
LMASSPPYLIHKCMATIKHELFCHFKAINRHSGILPDQARCVSFGRVDIYVDMSSLVDPFVVQKIEGLAASC